MARKTRQIKKTSVKGTRKSVKTLADPKIQHHHLLLRVELVSCPGEKNKADAQSMIHKIVRDINMKLLAIPHVYYVNTPKYNEGLTAIAPIETSHIAFHFWSRPDRSILHNPDANCLLQFDVYTCGTLSLSQTKKILHHLTSYGPKHIDVSILNRNWGMSLNRHLSWDEQEGSTWVQWLESKRFNGF